MVLTSVTPARGHFVILRFDTGAEQPIDKTVWEESAFAVGSSLTCEELTALCALSERRRAENKAVFLLSRRDLSRRQLEEKLCREKGRYCAERRDSAVAAASRMCELGYVNDTAYAVRTADCLRRVKGFPRRRVEEELHRRGLSREDVAEAMATLPTDDTELALAFLRKKRYTVPESTAEVQRIAAAMARFGFDGSTVRRALTLWQEEQENG